ncbi:MAG: 2-hydroxyacid dehydrogenase [Geminicoccaceae bacterium]
MAAEALVTIDVLVVFPNRPKAMAQLEAAYTLHHLWQAADPEKLLDEVGPRIRAAVSTGEKGLTAAQIAKLPRLEIVSCFGVGIDAIDRKACAARNIPITNTPDVLTDEVADMGLVLLLSLLRDIPGGDRHVRSGQWLKGAMPLTTCARGKKLGILGLGRIGKALARRAEVIGMQVAYHGRARQADVAYPYFDSLVGLAKDSDVLALCCPGGAETRGLVDAAVLEALGPEGYLVNVARGSVCDEPAVVDALVNRKIKAAALDVFADEPRVPQALLGLDNVILQPHAASATVETRDAMAQLVVDNLAAHFAGKPLLTPFR